MMVAVSTELVIDGDDDSDDNDHDDHDDDNDVDDTDDDAPFVQSNTRESIRRTDWKERRW